MKISTIITSYNQKPYLVEAIESVLAQTVPCYEVIIADDCSADGSQDLIEAYAREYPGRIRPILHSENLGIPRNRNFALGRVRGDLVSVLDGDDRFDAHKNEEELRAFQRHPDSAVVYSNVWFVDEGGHRVALRDRAAGVSGEIFPIVFLRGFGILRSMLVRYSVLLEVGFFDERFWHHDGFDLVVRLARKHRFVYVPDALVEYRIHAKGSSRAICNPSTSLEELHGVYEKNRHALDDLPGWEADLVRRTWVRYLAKLEGNIAWREGKRQRAVRRWLHALRAECARFLDPSLVRMVATSERARSLLRWSLSSARRRPPRSTAARETRF